MFITNKRTELPKTIKLDNFTVEIVDKFKLLGVTLDQSLNFNDFVAGLASAVTKKTFAINRLFFLSFDTKLQFFKTFILPYFDFGLSLIIYFSKTAIDRLARNYYHSLVRLFKFKLNNIPLDDINKLLSQHGLLSFEHRFILKLSKFSANVIHCPYAPSDLKKLLVQPEQNSQHNFRESTIQLISSDKFTSQYGEWTFQNFFANFYNKIKENRFLYTITDFKEYNIQLMKNLDIIVADSLKIFRKLAININLSFFN